MVTQAGSEQSGTVHGRTAHGRQHATHHGNSLAAWVMVLLLMLGALVAAIGVSVPSITLDVIGAVIVVIALIVGKVLSLAGYGSVKPADPEAPHGVS